MRARPSRGGAEGSAYLLTLTTLLAVTAITVAVARSAQLERWLGTRELDGLQASNAADSGLEVATALLLAGEPPSDSSFSYAIEERGGMRRESRVTIEAPELLASERCARCRGIVADKAQFRLRATGEVLVGVARPETQPMRRLARSRAEAELTVQPWGVVEIGGPDPSVCPPDVLSRVRALLLEELHPPGCRLLSWRRIVLSAVDLESGLICAVDVETCVRLVARPDLGSR